MSFLYKALLKDNHKNKSNLGQNRQNVDPNDSKVDQSLDAQNLSAQNLDAQNQFHTQMPHSPFHQTGFQQPFAQTDKPSSQGLMWLVIGILLLVIGLLAGFILGNTSRLQPLNEAEQIGSSNGHLNDGTPLPNQLKTEHLTPEIKSSTSLDSDNKHIETAVDQNGQVVSKVTGAYQSSSDELKSAANTSNDKALENRLADNTKRDANSHKDLTNEKRTVESGSSENNDDNKSDMDIEDIPADLKALFADAVKATEVDEKSNDALFKADDTADINSLVSGSDVTIETSLQDISTLSERERYFIPAMKYQMHIYASEKSARWVKINGQSLAEGDELVNGLTLFEIRQNNIIWQTDTRRFSQQALVDYP